MDPVLNPLECFTVGEILSELKEQVEVYQDSITKSKSECWTDSQKHGIENDLEFVLNIITQTRNELERDHTYSTLTNAVILDEDEEEKMELYDEKLVKQLEKELRELEESCRSKNLNQLYLINELKDQVHVAKMRGEKDCDFAKIWLQARNDFQQRVKQKDEILQIKSQIKSMNQTEERDVESYENVTAWTKLRVAQLERKISQWKDKLVRDVHTMEERVEARKGHIAEQELQIAALQELIQKRVQELIPWEEEKQQERRDRIQHMRRYYSCRKLQRWWRKYMVQNCLYKKKKMKPKAGPATKSKPKLEGKVKAKSPRNKK